MTTKQTITIYEYPRCSNCRNALKFLDASGVKYQKIDIVQQPPTKRELKAMLKYYHGNVRKLFNTSGEQYRALGLSEKLGQMSENQAIEMLSQNGKLVKRPFLLTDRAGCVGFQKPVWQDILK